MSHDPRSPSPRRRPALAVAGVLLLGLLAAPAGAQKITVELADDRLEPVASLAIGSTLYVGLRGLEPDRSYQVRLRDEGGFMVSYYQLTADGAGMIEPAALWYATGVVGCEMVSAVPEDPYRYATYADAERALAGRVFQLTVSATDGRKAVATAAVPLHVDSRPRIYLSDAAGCPQSGFLAGGEETADVYLSAERLPPGETEAAVFLIPDQRGCVDGTVLDDVRPTFDKDPQVVRFGGKGAFRELLWARDELVPGTYDVVVRLGGDLTARRLLPTDQVTHCTETGGVVQTAMPACPTTSDFDIAGRLDQNFGLPFFEFVDVFNVGDQMWGALEPSIVPQNHPGGNYAAFYVVPEGVSPGLFDVTEALEIVRVKHGCPNGCLNASITRIWNQADLVGAYDVVIDFGATPADSAAEWVPDSFYNSDRDFIDRDTMPGAWVVDDPADMGPHAVLDWEYAPDPSDPTDPLWTNIGAFFVPSSGNCPSADPDPIVPIHGLVRHPAGPGPYPLVLIVHGNSNPLVPSEPGYVYLLELLASHGMIAVSVDENCLNGGVFGEMDARAVVLLRHLQRWREFNTVPGTPFFGRVDMSRIGLAGHSRGGEAVTVAWTFNDTLNDPTDPDFDFGFDLRSFFAIAPVDGQIGGAPITLDGNAAYFVMHGSNDGDVFDFGGHRTYDRAHPVTGGGDAWKSLLFVHGANHNFWNTVWASNDDSSNVSSSVATISAADQQAIGRVYVSAFFRERLLGEEVYRPLFMGDLEFDSLPGAVRIHQYQDHDRIFLNHYEEDDVLATGSLAGVSNSPVSLSPYQEEAFSDFGSPFFLWQQTDGLIAGWSSPTAEYVVDVPATLGGDVCDFPFLAFRVGQVFDASGGGNLDFTVQLELASGPANGLKVSNFDTLPFPVDVFHFFFGEASKTVMKTVRIPLHGFLVNRINQDLQDVEQIRLRFNRNPEGLIAFDDLQITH